MQPPLIDWALVAACYGNNAFAAILKMDAL
jgi:hypothetical protein